MKELNLEVMAAAVGELSWKVRSSDWNWEASQEVGNSSADSVRCLGYEVELGVVERQRNVKVAFENTPVAVGGCSKLSPSSLDGGTVLASGGCPEPSALVVLLAFSS